MECSRRTAVVIATVLATLAWYASRYAHADDAERPQLPRILFTADTRGNLEPCGCEKGQFGGIARRATVLAELQRPGDILLDLGDLGGGPGELHRLGWRVMLDALRELKYDALVPGGSDLDAFEELVVAARNPAAVPVVCANLVRETDGKPVFTPWLLRTLPGGRTIAVVGLTSETQAAPAGHRIIPLKSVAKSALTELVGKADVVVLAGWIEGKPALELAKGFPACALVLAGRVPRGSDGLVRRDGAPVMAGGERGQYIVAVELDAHGRPTIASRCWLDDEIRDDPAMVERVRSWKGQLAKRADVAVAATLEEFRKAGRVGSAACAECHAAEHRVWAESKHARAMGSLSLKQEDRNPLCLRCHLQDVREESAVMAGDHAGGVGCEGCHGGGARHVESRRRNEPSIAMTAMGPIGSAACGHCHDEENSRHFDFKPYWRRIDHGRVSRPDYR